MVDVPVKATTAASFIPASLHGRRHHHLVVGTDLTDNIARRAETGEAVGVEMVSEEEVGGEAEEEEEAEAEILTGIEVTGMAMGMGIMAMEAGTSEDHLQEAQVLALPPGETGVRPTSEMHLLGVLVAVVTGEPLCRRTTRGRRKRRTLTTHGVGGTYRPMLPQALVRLPQLLLLLLRPSMRVDGVSHRQRRVEAEMTQCGIREAEKSSGVVVAGETLRDLVAGGEKLGDQGITLVVRQQGAERLDGGTPTKGRLGEIPVRRTFGQRDLQPANLLVARWMLMNPFHNLIILAEMRPSHQDG